MSEETRRILKVFGISTTKFEEAIISLEQGNVSMADAVRIYSEAFRELNNNMAEIMDLIARLHDRGLKALEKLAKG